MEKRTPEGKKKKLQYITQYTKDNYKQIKLNFNLESDKDILEKLEAVESKADYIRQLIRKDIKPGK